MTAALHAHYKGYLCMMLILVTCIVSFVVPVMYPSSPLNVTLSGKWGIAIGIVALLAVLAFYFEFESAAHSAREVALVSMLGTTSAVSRVPFAVLPNVQPCTYLIICSGYVFGPIAGFAVGAITAIVSNFFLGQGPHTLFQIFAWGLIGYLAGYLGRLELKGRWQVIALVIFGVFSAYLFGAVLNLWHWATFDYPLTWTTFAARETLGFWFDTFHAIGNVLLLWLLGVKTITILERFKKRFRVFRSAKPIYAESSRVGGTESPA